MRQFDLNRSFIGQGQAPLTIKITNNGAYTSLKIKDQEIHLEQYDIVSLISELSKDMDEGHIYDTVDKMLLNINSVAVPWSIEDIQYMRDDLSDNQAAKVLDHLKENHCNGTGINYHTIEETCQKLYPI